MTEVYVVGTDMIKFGRFPDRTVPNIGAEAALMALDDAGLTIKDMQALYCGNLGQASGMVGQRILRLIGQTGIPVVNCANACATGATALREGYAAIKAGMFALAVIGVLTSVVGAYYYLSIVKVMYFDEPLAKVDPVRIELRTHGTQLLEGDEFVQHQPRAEQVADGLAIVVTHAQQPGNWRKHIAEDLLQRDVEIAENAVAHGYQSEERDQHGRDVQCQLQSIASAARRGIDDVHAWFLHRNLDAPRCSGLVHFRDENLRKHDGGRRGHDHGRQQMLNLNVRHQHISGHHSA